MIGFGKSMHKRPETPSVRADASCFLEKSSQQHSNMKVTILQVKSVLRSHALCIRLLPYLAKGRNYRFVEASVD